MSRPVAFNNACISLYGFSVWFINAGARGYIGTLAAVGDAKAKEVAERFFALLRDDTSLPIVLWRAERDVFDNPKGRIYVHIGCHFNRIKPPTQDVSRYAIRALEQEIRGWVEYLAQDKPLDAKRNAERILLFMRKTLAAES